MKHGRMTMVAIAEVATTHEEMLERLLRALVMSNKEARDHYEKLNLEYYLALVSLPEDTHGHEVLVAATEQIERRREWEMSL